MLNKNIITNRQVVLDNINKGDIWILKNHERDKITAAVKKNLQWLKNNLYLEYVDIEASHYDAYKNTEKIKEFTGWLTNRQIFCMRTFNAEIQKNNIQGAFHELYDFIESYKLINDKPIDMVERIFISNAVIQLESIM